MRLPASVVFLAFAGVVGAAVAPPAAVTKAVAVLAPLGSSGVSGTVTFTKAAAGVRVTGRIAGLKEGEHGFHVHEFGDCSAADGSSAGGHFNPTAEPHAGPHDARRHAGDMGNVTALPGGTATLDYTDPRLSFEGANGILGRGVIVHANPDDLKSQPAGNAGGRLACGVVGLAKAD